MKILSIIIFTILFSYKSISQIGIGTTNPDPSATLEIKSNTKGFLPPRMTSNQKELITNPAEGLMVYCTDCCGGMVIFFNDSKWESLINCSQIDFDLDGVLNSIDLDDDNDGILDDNEYIYTEFITNGDFIGSGTTSNTTTLSGWSISPAGSVVYSTSSNQIQLHVDEIEQTLYQNISNINQNNEDVFINFSNIQISDAGGASNSDSIIITILYDNIEYVRLNSRELTDSITIIALNGAILNVPNRIALGDQPFDLKLQLPNSIANSGVFSIVANMEERDPQVDSNDDIFFDKISLFKRLSKDTDSDNKINQHDLDSDNDGCFDAIEGSANILLENLYPSGTIKGGVNQNGVPLLIPSGQNYNESLNANLHSACP